MKFSIILFISFLFLTSILTFLDVFYHLSDEIFNPELDEMKKLIRQEMETAFELNVPLAVDIGIGDNWCEAH